MNIKNNDHDEMAVQLSNREEAKVFEEASLLRNCFSKF